MSTIAAWFGSIGSVILALIVKDALNWFATIGTKWVQEYQLQKQTDAEAQASVQPLKNATDGKGVDSATDTALDHF